jgi:hypothetical protein
LIASTCRSNQSFTAWLVAHTNGPASSTPQITSCQRPSSGTPEATTPHAKAHMGGNQVIGLKSSVMAERVGRCIQTIVTVDGKKCQLKVTVQSSPF